MVTDATGMRITATIAIVNNGLRTDIYRLPMGGLFFLSLQAGKHIAVLLIKFAARYLFRYTIKIRARLRSNKCINSN